MRARFLLTPLSRPVRPGDDRLPRGSTLDITDRVLRAPVIHTRIDRDNWSWGIYSSGNLALSLADPEGLFAPASATTSIFNYAGMNNAVLEIQYPRYAVGSDFQTIWRGYLTERQTFTRPQDGVSNIYARTPDIALRESAFPASAVFDGSSLGGIVRAIMERPEIERFMGPLDLLGSSATGRIDGDPTPDGILVPEVASLFPDGPLTPSLDIMQDILQVTNTIMIYNTFRNRIKIQGRGDIFPPTPILREVISIDEYAEGAEQIYNRIIVTSGSPAPDHVAQADNLASQRKHGLRTTRINGRWLNDIGNARAVARATLRRLSESRRRLVVTTTPWALGDVRQMVSGEYTGVEIPAAATRDTSRYGTASYASGRYGWLRHQPYHGGFWIEQLQWRPETDTVQIHLREV